MLTRKCSTLWSRHCLLVDTGRSGGAGDMSRCEWLPAFPRLANSQTTRAGDRALWRDWRSVDIGSDHWKTAKRTYAFLHQSHCHPRSATPFQQGCARLRHAKPAFPGAPIVVCSLQMDRLSGLAQAKPYLQLAPCLQPELSLSGTGRACPRRRLRRESCWKLALVLLARL